jgi:hypothetical protein
MELHNLASLTQNLNMTRLFRGVALVGQEHGRTIPLAELPASNAAPSAAGAK